MHNYELGNEHQVKINKVFYELNKEIDSALEVALLKAVTCYLGVDWSYGYVKMMVKSKKLKLKGNPIELDFCGVSNTHVVLIKGQLFAKINQEVHNGRISIKTEYFKID